MRRHRRDLFWGTALAIAIGLHFPAARASANTPPLSLCAYLAEVGRANLDLAAQRANVAAAQAQGALAQVFPEPSVTAGIAAYDPTHQQTLGLALGVVQPIEVGGKRGARGAAAKVQLAGAQADLLDALRTLRTSAASAFVDALAAKRALQRRQQTLTNLERLVAINRERQHAGDVGEMVVVQSKVEAARFAGEVQKAAADLQAGELSLYSFLTPQHLEASRPLAIDGNLRLAVQSFSLPPLLTQARAARPDLLARRAAYDAAQAQLHLARASRWEDISVGANWQHNMPSTITTYAQPSNLLGATLTMALPLTRIFRGELQLAAASVARAQAQLSQAELQAGIEVRQALARYDAAVAALQLYTSGVVSDAQRVLAATLFSYRRGGATLLELFEAQRTENEVVLLYLEALAGHAKARFALEQAVGTWRVTDL